MDDTTGTAMVSVVRDAREMPLGGPVAQARSAAVVGRLRAAAGVPVAAFQSSV